MLKAVIFYVDEVTLTPYLTIKSNLKHWLLLQLNIPYKLNDNLMWYGKSGCICID